MLLTRGIELAGLFRGIVDEHLEATMPRNMDDESVQRMLERYHQGLLTKQELDDFLEIQRRRSEVYERALSAGRDPGRALREIESDSEE